MELKKTCPVFLATITVAKQVVASPQVAGRWDEPSALPEFSVRGLAGHLVRAALTVDTYLDRPTANGHALISVPEYYSHLDSDVTSALNTAVRQRGEELAAEGHEWLVIEFERLSGRLAERLTHENDDRLMTVAGDATMRLTDYLVTRIVELTVHLDDLAASVGLESPALPREAIDFAIGTLVDIARHRHGELAVLRALTRRERDTVDALRVF
jgi:uncharacterized protein (TIGR03083 family)